MSNDKIITNPKMVDFIRDPIMDTLIEDIIDIFTKLEGVELVRLSGMTLRARSITGNRQLTADVIDSIIRKLKANGIIRYHYIMNCPHCGEISYQVKLIENFKTKPKLCDSCSSFYTLLEGSTLQI